MTGLLASSLRFFSDERGEVGQVSWLFRLWRDDCWGREVFWKSGNLWLATVALLLPFGWIFLLLRLQPVRVGVRSLRRP